MLRLDSQAIGKTLHTSLGDGEKVRVVGFSDERDEARCIAQTIQRELLSGAPASDIAVLYRNNRMAHSLDHTLASMGIPTLVIGGIGFYKRDEIRTALAVLALSEFGDTRQGDLYFSRVCNTPARGLGPAALSKLTAYAEKNQISLMRAAREAPLSGRAAKGLADFVSAMDSLLDATASGLSLPQRLRHGITAIGYQASLEDLIGEETGSFIDFGDKDVTSEDIDRAKGRLDNLEELYREAAECEDLTQLLERMALQSRTEDRDAVRLMTVHAAKGLEFDHVYLIGMDEGFFPSERSEPDEEARLAYVAMSRAKRYQTVSWAMNRQGRSSGPSGFLHALPRNAIETTGLSLSARRQWEPSVSPDRHLMSEVLKQFR